MENIIKEVEKKSTSKVEHPNGLLEYSEFAYNAISLLYPPSSDPLEFGRIRIVDKEIQFKSPILLYYNNSSKINSLLKCIGRFKFQLGYYSEFQSKKLIAELQNKGLWVIYYTINKIILKFESDNVMKIYINYNSQYNLYSVEVVIENIKFTSSNIWEPCVKVLRDNLLHEFRRFSIEKRFADLSKFNFDIKKNSNVEYQDSYLIGNYPFYPIVYIEKSLYEYYKKSLKKGENKNE